VRILASIDVGSNTVRLLAAGVEDGRVVKEVLNLRATTRLGEGLAHGRRLKPEAIKRTLTVLKDYRERLKAAGVKDISAVATEALRRASDAGKFIELVNEETDIEIEVITGEEEARRTLIGIKAGLKDIAGPGPKLLIDIGGGSTELTYTTDWEDYQAVSLPLGAVSLYEAFLMDDPPKSSEIIELETACFKGLKPLKGLLPAGVRPVLIGTAGTITTLAALDMAMADYDPARVTGHKMSRETVARLLMRLAGLSNENRRLLAGIEPGREDIILSGTALLGTIMDVAGAGHILVSDSGLREGNLLHFFAKKGY